VGKFSWEEKSWYSVIYFAILTILFLADMFAANAGYPQAQLYQITFEKYFSCEYKIMNSNYNQYVFGISAVVILLAYLFFRVWYRHFYLNHHRFTWKGILAIIAFWILTSGFGIIAYYQFQTNPTILISTAISICPFLVSSIAFFSIF